MNLQQAQEEAVVLSDTASEALTPVIFEFENKKARAMLVNFQAPLEAILHKAQGTEGSPVRAIHFMNQKVAP